MFGYTCSLCGMWVASGSYHQCGGSVRTVPPTTHVTVSPNPAELRIASALERIADALEAAASPPKEGS